MMRRVKFAEFDEQDSDERWRDAVVRSMQASDVAAVAAIYAERADARINRAVKVASRWAEASTERLVLVVEHRGIVQGYGKAEWLVPQDRGGNAPTGWYLTGLVVAPAARRHGLGARLTEQRIETLALTTSEVWYVANLRNQTTIALHERQGFVLHTHKFQIPGVVFEGGHGALFRLLLTRP